jgi:hypothetical protein
MELSASFSDFYTAIQQDARIGATHISLYMALLHEFQTVGYKNPIQITRDQVMKLAKINARHTYNHCMNNLHEFGYIQYHPSTNGTVCSKVYLKFCESEKAK